jgi:hypothetical protein
MQGKAKYIYPVLTAGQMVPMVTLVATYINLGWRHGVLRHAGCATRHCADRAAD